MTHILTPDWLAPAHVHALMSTRLTEINGQVGVSVAPYDGLNLATHVGDDEMAVTRNRALLRQILPSEPLWLNQVHGVAVYQTSLSPTPLPKGARGFAGVVDCNGIPEADAVLLTKPNQVAVIMTADCLPVLFTNRAGTMVAAAHAGWRSLVNGVLENVIAQMHAHGTAAEDILVWLGAAIGAEQFEIGAEVRDEFIEKGCAVGLDAEAVSGCFKPVFPVESSAITNAHTADKYHADIYALARQRLQRAGISAECISGGGLCTVSDTERFYSYRRDGATGRMASLIWFDRLG